MKEQKDTAPLIYQAVNEHGYFEIRVLVELDGKLAAFGREWLTQEQRDAVLAGELRVARMLWVPEGDNQNDQVHWCISAWRRQGFAVLIRDDLVFVGRGRSLVPRVEVGRETTPATPPQTA